MPIRDYGKAEHENNVIENLAMGEGVTPRGNLNDLNRRQAGILRCFYDDTGGALTTAATELAPASFTLTTNQGFTTAPKNGDHLAFVAHTTNLGAVTLDVDLRGRRKLRKMADEIDVDLAAGDLQANHRYRIEFSEAADSGSGAWILGGSGNSGPVVKTYYFQGATDYASSSSTPVNFSDEIAITPTRTGTKLLVTAVLNMQANSSDWQASATGRIHYGTTGTTFVGAGMVQYFYIYVPPSGTAYLRNSWVLPMEFTGSHKHTDGNWKLRVRGNAVSANSIITVLDSAWTIVEVVE